MESGPPIRFVVGLRALPAMTGKQVGIVDQRQLTFQQVGRPRQPVVHLQIDVDVVVRGPGRLIRVIPDALQVGRHGAGARTADEQVTAVLEQHLFQIGIGLALFVTRQAPFHRHRLNRSIGCPEVQAHALVEGLVVFEVVGEQRRIALCGGRIDEALKFGRPALAHQVGLVEVEAGIGRQQECDTPSALHRNTLFVDAHCYAAALLHNPHPGIDGQPGISDLALNH